MGRLDISSREAPIYWCDGKQPRRKSLFVTTRTGVPVMEYTPQQPWKYYVKPSGNVVCLALTPSAADRNIRSAHTVQLLNRKEAAGWLPFNKCPIATGRMPRPLMQPEDEPCESYVDRDGRPIEVTGQWCCKHVDRIIEARKEEYVFGNNEYGEAFKNSTDKLLELAAATIAKDIASNAKPKKK